MKYWKLRKCPKKWREYGLTPSSWARRKQIILRNLFLLRKKLIFKCWTKFHNILHDMCILIMGRIGTQIENVIVVEDMGIWGPTALYFLFILNSTANLDPNGNWSRLKPRKCGNTKLKAKPSWLRHLLECLQRMIGFLIVGDSIIWLVKSQSLKKSNHSLKYI